MSEGGRFFPKVRMPVRRDRYCLLYTSLVFFWFLIFSVPTGVLMNKIGRKKTVLLSLIIDVYKRQDVVFKKSNPENCVVVV